MSLKGEMNAKIAARPVTPSKTASRWATESRPKKEKLGLNAQSFAMITQLVLNFHFMLRLINVTFKKKAPGPHTSKKDSSILEDAVQPILTVQKPNVERAQLLDTLQNIAITVVQI